MASKYTAELKRLAEEKVKGGGTLTAEALPEMAALVGKAFAVQPGEVAILACTQQGKFLRFLVPEKLQAVGQIPLTSTSALAARTAREQRAEIINRFAAVPHASVFEAVPLAEERGDPIQKIMSAPITKDSKVLGVIQVSRKGKSGPSAGPDFTPQDLRDLVSIATLLAPCLGLCSSDKANRS
jgi:GAF domain-containing protein